MVNDNNTHIHSDEMIPVNYNETNIDLTPDQLIAELRTEIKHLNREYEMIERTATAAVRALRISERDELADALSTVLAQIETHKVRYKHDSSTTAGEAPGQLGSSTTLRFTSKQESTTMGYYISTHQSSFSIRTEDFSKFFLLVQELMSDESVARLGNSGSYADGKKSESWFSWVVTADVRQACVDRDIRRVFTEWGYDLDFIVGHGEVTEFRLEIRDGAIGAKIGDEEKFFAAIAPVVVSGSFLDCHGENGEDWRWLWENGKFFSQEIVHTEIIYGEPIEINNKEKV